MFSKLKELLHKNFPFQPTVGQSQLVDHLVVFMNDKSVRKLFVLKGYAGTGKTTFTNTLIKSLPELNFKYVLLAPTGRAAKVLANYTNRQAFTIHKKIYNIAHDKAGRAVTSLRENKHTNTLFIIDEASMIGNSETDAEASFGQRKLLDDLFEYVYSGKNCFMMFIGDTAQLPPVKLNISPALDIELLGFDYNTHVFTHELKDVVRQQKDSGILLNATALRILINRGDKEPVLKSVGFDDVQCLNGNEVMEQLANSFNTKNADDAIVITRSNKQANRYNQYIRNNLFEQTDEISAGDQLMVLKNNYFWLGDESEAGFIANGDVVRVKSVQNIDEQYGFRFADVRIKLVDYPDEPELDVKILLDTIYAETPALSNTDSRKLWDGIFAGYEKVKSMKARMDEVRGNEFFNALQVKFAYAVTCHKAQGGQWKNVFVDQGYMTEESYTTEHLRWLYTAVSRATEKLYYVNFEDRFFRK
ncbi:MAG: AAA family ATPase [Bacteroidia bacterium]